VPALRGRAQQAQSNLVLTRKTVSSGSGSSATSRSLNSTMDA
jgi:hypothetical protein